MSELFEFLIHHGYAVLFVWVLAEQVGVPVPAAPMLLAAGVLVGEGFLRFSLAFILAVVASLISDFLWYLIGRLKGGSVLSLLCKISLKPDSCVRRTSDLFYHHGARSLLLAKFIPGLGTIAPPLAGIFRMSLGRFFLYDGLGACLWAGLFMGLGYIFSGQIEEVAAYALKLGTSLTVLVFGSLAAYIIWKYIQRQKFLRHLRIARITPEELKRKFDAGEQVMVVDVRHPFEFAAEPQTIPGAFYFPLEDIDKEHSKIPRDEDVILYCN
jgi:membrane protein DedA with SNARE-associated domain